MIYFPTKASCPNRATLAGMTKEQAATWAARAPSHVSEVSRLAEVETYFGLSHSELHDLHRAAVDQIVTALLSNAKAA